MGVKKKKQTIGYWYRLGVQIAVCHAPIDFITQLCFGERTAWTGEVQDGSLQINRPDLFGGEKREGGVQGKVTVYSGKDNQPIDPYVKAMRGSTSAQRGLLSLVFGDAGSVRASDLRAINFNMSTLSPAAEQRINIKPFGLLTSTNQEVTKEQAFSFISQFYSGIKPYQEGEEQDLNGNGTKGEYVEPIEEQKKIYGSYRAVALMYAYRAFVIGNLINNPRVRLTADEFFGKQVRDEVIDRRGTNPFYWCAMNPYFKAVWVRVQAIYQGWQQGVWYPERAEIMGSPYIADNGSTLAIRDMNPAHIIYKTLTNTVWGLGYNPSDIDDASFRKAADKLYDEKFGLSLAWRNEKPIEDFIGGIVNTINAALRVNVITGKFELLLIRDDYRIEDLPVLDENCIISLDKFERASWGNTPNEVVMTYHDRDEESAVVTVQNLSAIEVQGGVISSSTSYEGIHEPELAAKIAERELRVLSNPLAKVSLKVNRMGFLLQNGDVFNLKWENLGIKNLPCRVMSITRGEFDDGTIEIEAVEDVFGLPQQTYVTHQGSLWRETNDMKPKPIETMRLWETPYYDLVAYAGEQNVQQSNMGEGNTFVRTFAQRPTQGSLSYDLQAATLDIPHYYLPTAQNLHFTATFNLADRIDRLTETLPITWINDAPSTISDTMYIVIDDEVMLIENIDEAQGVIRVKRGILDTIPEYHAANTVGWITDGADGVDETFRAQGDRVHYRFFTNTTRGTLPFGESTHDEITLVGRPYRPFPPAAVSIGGYRFPEKLDKKQNLNVAWATRNRKLANKTFHYWYGSITSEAGVTYGIKVYDPTSGKVHYEESGITDLSRWIPAPRLQYAFTLPNTINGLLFHHKFEQVVNGNEFAPVAGSERGNAKMYESVGSTNPATPTVESNPNTNTNGIRILGTTHLDVPMGIKGANLAGTFGFRINMAYATRNAPLLFIYDKDTGKCLKTFFVNPSGRFGFHTTNDWRNPTYTEFSTPMMWVDVILRIDNVTGKIEAWIDGVKAATNQSPAWNNTTSGYTDVTRNVGVYIGATNDGYNSHGIIAVDDVFMYDRALSDGELQQVMDSMVRKEWTENVAIELYSERGNIRSWQTFRHRFKTE